LATQNPIEQEGTYPLPEAQLDRFMFNLWLDYPSGEEEINIVKSTTSGYQPDINKVLNSEDIIGYQRLVREVPVADNVVEYAVSLVRSTRPETASKQIVKDFIRYGAGPRASQYLILGAKSLAAMDGRYSPEIDDVNAIALSVLRHRIVTNFNAEAENVSTEDIVRELIGKA
jgi:MoxR-like ATPase